MSIESQFWTGLEKPEPKPLNLDIKIVEKFPENIYSQSKSLICWAFKAFEDRPTISGFHRDGGQVNIKINKCYAIVNENGIAQEILVHDHVRSFNLKLRESASAYQWLLTVFKDNDTYYDSDVIKSMIRNKAEEDL